MQFGNISDNFMTMFAKLDGFNRRKLISICSEELNQAIRDRLESVDSDLRTALELDFH